MNTLSILIPSRSEQYLSKTISDIFEHAEGDIEVIVGHDGGDDSAVSQTFMSQHFSACDRMKVFCSQKVIGQRAMTNKLAKLSTAKYVLKCDAHVSFSQGFDVKMMQAIDDKTIMAPYLLKLDAEKWEVLPQLPSSQFVFDTNLVMQYDRKAENQKPITETMCLQGSAWMITRENYWKWNICDETLGSWGKQGTELGIKAYLNGGRCVVNKNCFYGHLFRENETDFPYQRDKEQIRNTSDEVIKRYRNKDIVGLIRKFATPIIANQDDETVIGYNFPADWTEDNIKELCK
jgi:hypothetical protein